MDIHQTIDDFLPPALNGNAKDRNSDVCVQRSGVVGRVEERLDSLHSLSRHCSVRCQVLGHHAQQSATELLCVVRITLGSIPADLLERRFHKLRRKGTKGIASGHVQSLSNDPVQSSKLTTKLAPDFVVCLALKALQQLNQESRILQARLRQSEAIGNESNSVLRWQRREGLDQLP